MIQYSIQFYLGVVEWLGLFQCHFRLERAQVHLWWIRRCSTLPFECIPTGLLF